ncbi:MAG: phosphodiester glycosidase family protein [Chloroflexota bacterium]
MKRLLQGRRLLFVSLSLAVGLVAWLLLLYPGTVGYRPVEPPTAFRWNALADALRASRGLQLAAPERGEPALYWLQRSDPLSFTDRDTYRVILLASRAPGVPADVYAADLRLDGDRVSLRGLRNLSRTPDSSEERLTGQGQWLAWADRVFDRYQSVTVMDLKGQARKTFALNEPEEQVSLKWEEGLLLVEFGRQEGPLHTAWIDPVTAEVREGNGLLVYRPLDEGEITIFARLIWFFRESPLVGPQKIALAENIFFSILDLVNRTAYNLGLRPAPPESDVPEFNSGTIASPTIVPGPPEKADAGGVPSLEEKPVPTAEAVSADDVFVTPISGTPLRRGVIFPDRERPYARVDVVEMDISELQLYIVHGTLEPRSTTGLVGTGMVPEDPDTRANLVATFNGGFGAMHGAYGMMVNRQIYLPPKDGLATVGVYQDGTVRLAKWGKDMSLTPDLVSFRQNCPPLIERGVINPELSELKLWGLSVSDQVYIPRSGLGQTRDGRLIYAIGRDITARTLAEALKRAGAWNAMQLDVDEFGVVFISYQVTRDQNGRPRPVGTKLRDDMHGSELLNLRPYAVDFFYVLRKPQGAKPTLLAPNTPTPAASATLATPRDPALAGLPGKIAFTSSRDGSAQVYVMRPDGTGQTRLTSGPYDNWGPAWSPDGRKIAFTSRRDGNAEIYVMDADGSGQKRLTFAPSEEWGPAWSPDGSKIAFHSDREGRAEIYVMKGDGSGVVKLTPHKGNNENPSWSPDGQRLAFDSDWEDYGKISSGFTIYTMPSQGGETRKLVPGYTPAWSPDGQRLAYAAGSAGLGEIWLLGLDGSGRRQLTSNSTDDRAPTWSPDGQWLAFASQRDGDWEIYVMKADGTSQTRLTHQGGTSPSWSR